MRSSKIKKIEFLDQGAINQASAGTKEVGTKSSPLALGGGIAESLKTNNSTNLDGEYHG